MYASIDFSNSFDVNIYKENNCDLQNMNIVELILHYNKYGKDEGRISSKINCRNDLIVFINSLDKICLEIGPFDCPVLTDKNI